ncbi:hypothetical protein LCGC14_1414440 [marine sediment metagenome]|uniref:Uncharacterized protein n=1 Tax=marine sediment metagenome TaxID=412755 RepID=A0A0F9M8R2_9ZZZZ
MSRYAKQHYKDVARILAEEKHFQETSGRPEGRIAAGAVINLKHTFADLFAADSPPSSRCWTCGNSEEAGSICTRRDGEHRFGGFDREQFLTACELRPRTEQGYSDYVEAKIAGELD